MAHVHSVYDSDTHFSINPVTRVLRNEASGKTSVIQHDHNSERFTFEIPRIVEGHDMSKCNVIRVHYINIDAKTKAQATGVYEVEDMQISPNSDDMVICSWLISRNATQLVGSLNFLIRFTCVNDGVVDYAWNTAVYSGISVASGINADETFADDYLDVINQWKLDVLQDITEEAKAEVTAWKEVESGKVRDEMTAFGEQWNDTLDVERVRISELTAMRGDSYVAESEVNIYYSDWGAEASGICKFFSNGYCVGIEVKFTQLLLDSEVTAQLCDIPNGFDHLQQIADVFNGEIIDDSDGSRRKVNLYISGGALCLDNRDQNRIDISTDSMVHYAAVLTASYPLKNPVIPELADIRVDVNGTSHECAGDAVRGSTMDLNVALQDHDVRIGDNAVAINILQETLDNNVDELHALAFDIVEGVYINSNGNEATDSTFSATDYIRITHSVEILTYVGTDNSRHAFYDKDKNFISAENDGAIKGVLTSLDVPENARYIRVSCWKNQASKMVVKSGTVNDRFIAQQDAIDSLDNRVKGVENIGEKVDAFTSGNYEFPTIEIVDGNYVSAFSGLEGAIASDTYSCYTRYVEVIPNTVVKIKGVYLSGNRSVCAYDRNKKYIEVLRSKTADTEIIVNVGDTTKYIMATGKAGIAPTFEYVSIVPKRKGEEYHKLNGYNVLFENATKKPVVSIIDDDTWSTTAVTAFHDKCNALGIKGSYACLTSRLEADENTGLVDLLLQYEREGFPVLTHGHTQGEFYKGDKDPATKEFIYRDLVACENDLVTGLQKLHKYGFTDYKCCWSVPYGYYDADLQSLAKKWGFESLVSNISYKAEEPMWHNAELPFELYPNRRYEIRRVQFTNKDTLDALKVIVDAVAECNGWFIVTTHFAQPANSNIDFLGGENADGEIVKGAFAEFVEYAKAKGCEFRTFNEELRNRKPIYNAYEAY